jgi:hypothetical protein
MPAMARPADWLEPMHRPAIVGRVPEAALGGGERGNDTGGDPAHQRDAQRQLVADAVLQIAPGKRTPRRGEVEHKDQHHGFLRLEADHLLGINGRQRDRHRHAALVGHAQASSHMKSR